MYRLTLVLSAISYLSFYLRGNLKIGEMKWNTSNRSNYWHAFVSRGFVSDSWAFLFLSIWQISGNIGS